MKTETKTRMYCKTCDFYTDHHSGQHAGLMERALVMTRKEAVNWYVSNEKAVLDAMLNAQLSAYEAELDLSRLSPLPRLGEWHVASREPYSRETDPAMRRFPKIGHLAKANLREALHDVPEWVFEELYEGIQEIGRELYEDTTDIAHYEPDGRGAE